MSTQTAPLNRQTARRFGRAVRDLLTSEVRRRAIGLLILLLVFALSVNGLNVVNSYVGRDFMTAIADRNMSGFIRLAILYVGVFAASTAVAVLYRFCEERLGLLWRSWLTKRVTGLYLARRRYLRIRDAVEIDNPDQRIAEDIRAFTSTTLSFALILLNSILAAVSFSGVLWSISPLLFGVAVGYAAFGTVMTILLGRPLVGLNYAQFGREADFRAALIHVRENADSIALLRREGHLRQRLLGRIDALVGNFRRITSVNRNLGFFTTGYSYLIQIIPTLLVAPQFMRGEVEFGVITQSAMAFTQLLGAFSLIVNQFGSLSSFAAVIARLSGFAETVETIDLDRPTLETIEDRDRVGYEGLTLRALQDDYALLTGLSVSIPSGMRVLVTGPNEAARVALFRATAGIWPRGEGRIVRPPLSAIFFLPQQPYLAPGTLREVLIGANPEKEFSDGRILAAIRDSGLDSVVKRAGGLDVEHDWSTILSLGEQQQLVITQLILAQPSFAVLDRVSTTLGQSQLQQSLRRLTDSSIAYINLDEPTQSYELYDFVLEISSNGAWTWKPSRPTDEATSG
jgi:putative ATP-binding cassette transporter